MKLPNWLTHSIENPAVIGRVDITESEVEAESLHRHEEKLRRAKDYIARREIRIPAAYGKLT